MAEHQPMPVSGYSAQSAAKTALANELKAAEERYLRILDRMVQADPNFSVGPPMYDHGFISRARTSMWEANMWAVRAIFPPTRGKLPEDAQ